MPAALKDDNADSNPPFANDTTIFSAPQRLSIDSGTTLVPHDDSDENTVHEADCSEPQPRKEPAPEPTLDMPIAKMTTLILDDPCRPSKLRPLVLVINRNTTSTITYWPLPKPDYSMDALARNNLSVLLPLLLHPDDLQPITQHNDLFALFPTTWNPTAQVSPTTNPDDSVLLSPATGSFTAQEVEGHFQFTHTTPCRESLTPEVPYD
ncbi:hypothetical protein F4604DRAFT_1953746 [Suillus subluteus]|nr:hypothetical protein F4604DRAFT_1953746 [Suillus subluteus]